MGAPLRIGGKNERYSRVKNTKQYFENYEAIFGKDKKSVGRIRIRYLEDGSKETTFFDKSVRVVTHPDGGRHVYPIDSDIPMPVDRNLLGSSPAL